MARSPTTQEDDQTSDILWLTQSLVGDLGRQGFRTTLKFHQAGGHLGGVETGSDGVCEDATGAQLDGEVLGQMDDGSLGGRVRKGGVLAEGADAQAGDTGGHDDATGVLDGGALLQQRGELLGGVEDALDVEVHDLAKGIVRVCVKGGAPCGTGVGEEDVDVVGGLGDLGDQTLDLRDLGGVGGDGDGDGARSFVGEGVEGRDGFFAGRCLS